MESVGIFQESTMNIVFYGGFFTLGRRCRCRETVKERLMSSGNTLRTEAEDCCIFFGIFDLRKNVEDDGALSRRDLRDCIYKHTPLLSCFCCAHRRKCHLMGNL